MKIKFKSWRGVFPAELSDWIADSLAGDSEGTVERLQEQAENNSKAIGRLCETLVEESVLRLEQVQEIVDSYDIVKIENDR